jgi:hypothetical protein
MRAFFIFTNRSRQDIQLLSRHNNVFSDTLLILQRDFTLMD